MTRLEDQRKKQGVPVPADPLPKTEGDSSQTEIVDDNDAPPGIDPKGAHD